MNTAQHNAATRRKQRNLISVAVFVVVIGAAIVAGLQFGKTSPLIAKGNVVLKDGLEERAKGLHTLFIIVRDSNSPMPMPYGAARFELKGDAAKDFHNFMLTNERLQVMNPEMPPPQVMDIKARLDGDGSGGMDQPGDLVGDVKGVTLGSTGVTVTIDRVIE